MYIIPTIIVFILFNGNSIVFNVKKMVRLSLSKCALIFILIIASLISVLVLRAVLYFSIPPDLISCENIEDHKPITGERPVVQRLIQALRYRTITKAPQLYDSNEIKAFIQFLNRSESFLKSFHSLKTFSAK